MNNGEMFGFLLAYLVLYVAPGILIGLWSKKKGYGMALGLLLSCLLSPLIAVIVIALKKTIAPKKEIITLPMPLPPGYSALEREDK